MSKVVLVGSSIFAQWERASHGFIGHHVKNCAIGGTTSEHWLKLLIGVLDNEAPDALCFYCGSNDFNLEIPDDQIIENVLSLFDQAKAYRSDLPLAYWGIIKAPQKMNKWDRIDVVNSRIMKGLQDIDYYVDTNKIFFLKSRVRSHFFIEDQLHLTKEAYEHMNSLGRQFLSGWL